MQANWVSRWVGTLLWALAPILSATEAAPNSAEFVQQLDLIHFSHTDYGFTDHPAVCRDLQVRYLDLAIDTARTTRHLPDDARFRWTAETTVAVDDWWQDASPARVACISGASSKG